MRRPLGTFAAAFYIFACVFFTVGRSGRTWITVLSLIAFAVILFTGRKFQFRRAFAAILSGMLAASVFAGFVVDVKIAGIETLDGEEKEITGTVIDVRYSSSWEGSYTVETDGIGVLLYSDNGELRSGDVIRCTVSFSAIDSSGDIREYLFADGIVIYAETVGEITVTGRATGLWMKISQLQRKLSARLRSAMSEDVGGFSAALILGDRRYLSESVTRDFRALGISHVLALSGTHLTALFAAVGNLVPARRRYMRFFILCPAVLFYMALAGFSSSVVRAGIMFIISSAASAVNRETDSFASLSVSVLLICIVNPFAPFDMGLQLSFASVCGLIISDGLQKEIAGNRRSRLAGYLRKFLPTFVVPAAVLPLMWLRFGEVSLVSPVSNILFVPLVSILIPMLGILLLLSAFPVLFVLLASAADFVISVFLKITKYAAGIADPILPLRGKVTLAALVVFVVAMAAAVLASGKVRRICVLSTVLFLPVTLLSAQLYASDSHRGMTVCYASSETDEAICAISGGFTLLIDVGRYPSAVRAAADLGVKYGSGRVDALLFTHLHQSHRLTLSVICENYYVDSLWLPAPEDDETAAVADGLRDEAENMGIDIFTYVSGERLSFGECEFSSPNIGRSDHSTHPAVEFSLECEGKRLVYTSSGSDFNDTSYEDVRIMGVHGPEPRGTVEMQPGEIIAISSRCAGILDAVPAQAVVSDKTVIRFPRGSDPFAEVVPET